jgi:RNA polymerase sigma-70 factor (ECF subfamily)
VDPDGQLVERAQRGDQTAFAELVERHQHRMFTLAARTLGSRTDAEDAVQDAFVRAWRGLGSFRGGSLFSTWLYRICVNAAHDHRSRRRPDPVEPTDTDADPRDRFADEELSGELQRALGSLEEHQRVTVILFDVLGVSYAEIAEITKSTEGTVKSRLFRGRAELAKQLRGTQGAEDESK